MARDTEQLVLQLSADMRSFQQQMLKAAGEADRAAQRVERRFAQQNRTLERQFSQTSDNIRSVLAAIGVGIVVRDVVQLGDVWTTVGNRIAVAGVESSRLASVQQTVADIASRTRSDLDSTADLFARMYRSSEDLGASLTEVLAVTELVSKALAGAAQSEREGAIRQLGQGLGSGRLQGDELRSILENSRPIAEAIAAEFGVAVGQLRELGKRGELESRRVFEAILRAGPEIEAAFARTTFTVEASFTRLRTEAARFIGTNEQAAGSQRALARLIDFAADNFDLLADAVIVAATALGGAFAGRAVVQATMSLRTMVTEAGKARAVLAAFGGWAGLAVTALGGALAVIATRTDWLTSSAEALQRASDTGYTALQRLASLNEDLSALAESADGVASGTREVAEVADDARAALTRMSGASEEVSSQLDTQGRISTALAEIERDRTLDTLRAAYAQNEDAAAAIRRTAALRGLMTTLSMLATGQGTIVDGVVAGQLTQAERDQIAALERSNREIYGPGIAAAEGVDIETWQAILDRQIAGAAATQETAAAQGRSRAELERQAELGLARLRHEYDRVAALEDAEQVEKRTQALVAAGYESIRARAMAEAEVREEREAMNAESQRMYAQSLRQDQIEIARLQNNAALADVMSDQLEIQSRTRQIQQQLLISEEEARVKATAQVQERRAAAEMERSRNLARRSLELELELARARGDERAERAIRRRLELEAAILELRREGVADDAAIQRAQDELDALEDAGAQGRFRQWFADGGIAAMNGELGDFIEQTIRERFERGARDALMSLADALWEQFAGVFADAMRGGDGFGDMLAETIGGLNESAADAATKLALTGAASAASAAKEAAAATTKSAAATIEVTAMKVLASSAYFAADALRALAASTAAGGASSFLGGGIIGAIGSFFGGLAGGSSGALGNAIFGGFRAEGGGVDPSKWYWVGERGAERFVPTQPGVIIPAGGFGGGISVSYVDARKITLEGTGAEIAEMRQAMAEDLASRKQQIVQVVRDAASRRQLV